MILLKFPSRSRPKQLIEVLYKYYNTCKNKSNVRFLVSLDHDDTTITKKHIDECAKIATVCIGSSDNKIFACNRDIHKMHDWDIVVLASDDMIPIQDGWDERIQDEMDKHYPDTDGVLFFNDGYSALNTMCILGKKYYDRFGYIYHPDYISLFSDNEFMEVADILKRQTRFTDCLFKHEHWANNNVIARDASYNHNERFYNVDQETYFKRKEINFGL